MAINDKSATKKLLAQTGTIVINHSRLFSATYVQIEVAAIVAANSIAVWGKLEDATEYVIFGTVDIAAVKSGIVEIIAPVSDIQIVPTGGAGAYAVFVTGR